MSSKSKTGHSSANHERWLVSYADFITLLFAFFVVMFAASQSDKKKARQVSDAVESAFNGGKTTLPGRATGVTSKPAAYFDLEPALKTLSKQLAEEIKAGKMSVRLEQRGLIVSLNSATFFPSGEDALDPSNFASLEKVAAAVRGFPNPIRLEGHTDSIPIHTARFRSNWDLSAGRAIAVMELLRDKSGISASRLAITGYAETVPLEANDNEAGRARNRRVDIVILSAAGGDREPTPKSR